MGTDIHIHMYKHLLENNVFVSIIYLIILLYFKSFCIFQILQKRLCLTLL